MVWSAESGQFRFELGNSKQPTARSLGIDEERGRIFVGHQNGQVSCWDQDSGELIRRWDCFGDAVSQVDLLGDRLITTCRSSSQLRIWEPTDLGEVASLDLEAGYIERFEGSANGSFCIAVTPTGVNSFPLTPTGDEPDN